MNSLLWYSHICKRLKRVWSRQSTSFLHLLQIVKWSTAIQQPGKGRALQKECWKEKSRKIHQNRAQSKSCIQKPLDLGPVVQIRVTQISCLIPSAKPKSSWAFICMKARFAVCISGTFLAIPKKRKMGKDCWEEVGGAELMRGTLLLWYRCHYLTFLFCCFQY